MSVVEVDEAARSSRNSTAILIDIRSPSAWVKGVPEHAKLWSTNQLLTEVNQLKDQAKKIYIICYRGETSARLVKELRESFGDWFYSVTGGYEVWKNMGLPVEMPSETLVLDRYERQVKLPGFGQVAQQKLTNSHVMVIGAGGLGVPALLYLVGAGIGQITIIDDDTVSLHNLHRQVLYQQSDIGLTKTNVAKKRLSALNNDVKFRAIDQRFTAENAATLVKSVDFLIDGTDNVSSRYLINDVCLKFNIPWLYAAVSGFDIQLSLFLGDKSLPCYRCLFPHMEDEKIENCSEAGVLGPVPGLAGMLQATETIKYLTGLGADLSMKMLSYDVLNHQFKVLKYPAEVNSNCMH